MKYLKLFILCQIGSFSIYSQTLVNNLKVECGTSIVTLITKDTIWMAADRMITDGVSNNASHYELKIHNYGNFFYAFAGITKVTDQYNNNKILFDPIKKMGRCLSANKPLTELIDSFGFLVVPELTILCDTLKKRNPTLFNDFFKKHLLELCFATFIDGVPNYQYRAFGLIGNCEKWEVKKQFSYVYDKKAGTQAVLGGEYKVIQNFLNNNKGYLLISGDLEKRLVCLIKKEADITPGVGLPADVVCLYKNGNRWYYNNNECVIEW